ncbi:MAG: hypothetical protein GX861_00830 [Tenericutes bacterium]|nr:hypothetical protein [Mycoplasmatota bacterium]
MKRLNNKGISIIELLIGFVIVMLIFISLFSIVLTYRDRLQAEEFRHELITFQTTLYKTIYDDINNTLNPLSEVKEATCEIEGDTKNCIVFIYETGFINLFIDVSGKTFYYKDMKYTIPDPHYVNFVPIDDINNYFKFTTNTISGKTIFTFDLELEHLEIKDVDFGLHIVGVY